MEKVLILPETKNQLPDALAALPGLHARAEAERVEQRILAGETDFTIDHPFGRTTRYMIPGWRQHPVLRLRLAFARWRHNRRIA